MERGSKYEGWYDKVPPKGKLAEGEKVRVVRPRVESRKWINSIGVVVGYKKSSFDAKYFLYLRDPKTDKPKIVGFTTGALQGLGKQIGTFKQRGKVYGRYAKIMAEEGPWIQYVPNDDHTIDYTYTFIKIKQENIDRVIDAFNSFDITNDTTNQTPTTDFGRSRHTTVMRSPEFNKFYRLSIILGDKPHCVRQLISRL